MKKVLRVVALSLLTVALISCSKAEGGSKNLVEGSIKSTYKVKDIKGNDDYRKFYEEFVGKLNKIVEADGKFYMYTSDEGDIHVNRSVGVDNESVIFIISLSEYEGKLSFRISNYPREGVNVEELNDIVMNMTNELFGYNISKELLVEKAKETQIFSLNDNANFFISDEGAISFEGEVVANVEDVDLKDPRSIATKEEIEAHNTLYNGEVEKILSRYELNKNKVDTFLDDGNSNNFDLPIAGSYGHFTYEHEYVIYEDEKAYVEDYIEVYKIDDYDTIEEQFDAEVKGLFEDIYGDTKLYEQVKEAMAKAPNYDENKESIYFTPDVFGFTKVKVKTNESEGYSPRYEIKIEYSQSIE